MKMNLLKFKIQINEVVNVKLYYFPMLNTVFLYFTDFKSQTTKYKYLGDVVIIVFVHNSCNGSETPKSLY